MSRILIDGCTVDEVLSLSNEELNAIVLRDEPLVFKAGSANLLGPEQSIGRGTSGMLRK